MSTGDRRPGPAPAPASSPARSAPATRERRNDGPRRVRNGVKLRTREGELPAGRLADPVVGWVERTFGVAARDAAVRYARLGQTVTMDVEPGVVRAAVQGTASRPYKVELAFGVFDPAAWEQVIERMADEAVYLVKLREHDLPEGLETMLIGLGLNLLPDPADGPSISCTCAEPAPCKHAATVAYLLAEHLVQDPPVVLALRGLPLELLVERLRQARLLRARGVASAHADPMIPETQTAVPPLESCLEEYWRPGPEFAEAARASQTRHVPHALLRRLGPSPLQGKFPLVGLLASIYDRVTEYAVGIEGNGNGDATESGPAADSVDGDSDAA